ncbi:MAG: TonB family protein [Kofleriaceae bacterium]
MIGSLSAALMRDVRAEEVAACSNRDALTGLLRRRHDFSAKIDVQRCAAIRTGQLRPTWVAVAMFQQPKPKKADATQYTHSMFVINADGDIVAAVQLGVYSEMDMGKSQDERVTDLRSIDLDGDGVDEVILDGNQGRWDVEQKLDVFQLSGSQLKLALSVPIGFENGGKAEHPTSCSGRWTISGRQIVVTNGERTGPERERVCQPPGSTAYAMRAGRFVKLPGATVTTNRSPSSIKTRALPKGYYGYVREYPAEARALGIEGDIRVRLLVDEQGKVKTKVLLNRLGHGLDELALQRVAEMVFEPAKDTDDKPVASLVVWTFHMTLPR